MKKKPEKIFLWIVLIFGIIATFIQAPLSTGDEGYHISIEYNMFSKNHPMVMDHDHITTVQASVESDLKNTSLKKIVLDKVDLKNDGVKINVKTAPSSTAPIDIMHLPAAIGVVLARLIYPSYGVMDYAARLSNLVFFTVAMYFIIKRSKTLKWTALMLFTVPFYQKIASPSYDVFCFVAIAAFALNLFELAKEKSFKDLPRSQILYSLFTIALILFAKKNYIFALFALLGLPIITQPIEDIFKRLKVQVRFAIGVILALLTVCAVIILNNKLDLQHWISMFINSYLNVETMGRRARQMWIVTPPILPSIFNILWLGAVAIVAVSETKTKWSKQVVGVFAITYFANWVGIFTGFYSKTAATIDELAGRYLSPYLIFFVPILQNFGLKHNIKIDEKTLARIAIISTIVIFSLYLITTWYRGFVIKVNPTWTNIG